LFFTAIALVGALAAGTGMQAAGAKDGTDKSGELISRLAFFTVENCPDCERVDELINAYRHHGPGKVKISYYDLDDPEALRLNEMLCRELNVPRENRRIAPALFSAVGALIYEDITEESLAHMVEEAAGKPAPAELHGGAFADAEPVRLRTAPGERTAPGTEQDAREQAPGHVLVTFFTKHHCADCRRARQVITDTGRRMESDGELEIDVRTLHVDDATGAETCMTFMKGLGYGERIVAPALVSSRQGLLHKEITEKRIEELFLAAAGVPSPEAVFSPEKEDGSGVLGRRFRELTAGAVALGGLADGVLNPCAFTVIVFFIAYLTHIGTSRRRILSAGLTFMGAVFFTYLALSAGLLRVLMFGAGLSMWLSYGLMLVTGVLVLFISVMSFRDAVAVRSGGVERMRLGLPEGLKSYLRRLISGRARNGLTAFGTVGLGMVVAAVELPCTGMMLVPIVVVLSWAAQAGEFGIVPYGWLLLYNLAFILPLILVFVLVYFGVTSEQLTSRFRRHIFASKLALGFVFLFLAAVLLLIPLFGRGAISF